MSVMIKTFFKWEKGNLSYIFFLIKSNSDLLKRVKKRVLESATSRQWEYVSGKRDEMC